MILSCCSDCRKASQALLGIKIGPIHRSGLLPYWWAFVIWESAGLVVYWLGLRPLIGADGFLLAFAFPGVLKAILAGHAEFMLAGLLGAALLRLDDRPSTAGALIGFCAIKPHLFLLVPVALIAGAQWRAILAACITIVAIAALSITMLGPEPWRAFLAEVAGMSGGIGAAEGPFYQIAAKQQSAFAFGASIGGLKAALMLQTVVTLVAAVTVALVWHRSHALDIRAMVLCCATLLATPYVFDRAGRPARHAGRISALGKEPARGALDTALHRPPCQYIPPANNADITWASARIFRQTACIRARGRGTSFLAHTPRLSIGCS